MFGHSNEPSEAHCKSNPSRFYAPPEVKFPSHDALKTSWARVEDSPCPDRPVICLQVAPRRLATPVSRTAGPTRSLLLPVGTTLFLFFQSRKCLPQVTQGCSEPHTRGISHVSAGSCRAIMISWPEVGRPNSSRALCCSNIACPVAPFRRVPRLLWTQTRVGCTSSPALSPHLPDSDGSSVHESVPWVRENCFVACLH